MQELDDITLLREYAERDSEEAFATLVNRHVNKVYSVALRHTRNPHQAEEITQAVFVILAQKSRRLGKKVILSGWLYQTARLTALTFIRSEIRRTRREQEAQMQSLLNETQPDLWPYIAPLLDAAMAGLSETDRHAVVLRFFDGKSMREIGAAMGASEDAAKMRVNRAVEKLQSFFSRHGVTSTTGALTAAISANSVQTAPAALAITATAIATAKGATASTSTLALAKGALKVMTWANAQTAVMLSAGIILAAGATTTVLVSANGPQKESVISGWRFAGYKEPEATIQTLAWAVSRGDANTLFGCLTPDFQLKLRKAAAQTQPGWPAEYYLLQLWKSELKDRTAIQVVQSQNVSTNQVLLDLIPIGGEHVADHWVKLQKIGEQWKVEDLDPKGNSDGTGITRPQYGGVGLVLGLNAQHEVQITRIVSNSPAARAGLVAGLVLRNINGKPIRGKTPAECVFLTRGIAGTTISLQVADAKLNQTNTVELSRQKYMR